MLGENRRDVSNANLNDERIVARMHIVTAMKYLYYLQEWYQMDETQKEAVFSAIAYLKEYEPIHSKMIDDIVREDLDNNGGRRQV